MANLWIFKNFRTKKILKDYKGKLEKSQKSGENSKIQLDPNLSKILRQNEWLKLEIRNFFLSSFSGIARIFLMISKGKKFLKIHRLASSQHHKTMFFELFMTILDSY